MEGMGSRSATELLLLPVRLQGIRLGRPIDLLLDPEAWRVVDGKLYLNYSKGVQKKWEQDVPGNIIKADKSWPDLHK